MTYRTFADVFLLLVRDGRVLLALRENTGYADGLWNLPSGKLEPGEDLASAAAREAHEEVGLRLDPAGLRLATVVHHQSPGEQPRIGFFFLATEWSGEPHNAEPHKCGGIAWHPLDRPPPASVPYSDAGLQQYRRGETYGVHG